MDKIVVVDCSFCSIPNCSSRNLSAKDNCLIQQVHDGKSKICRT